MLQVSSFDNYLHFENNILQKATNTSFYIKTNFHQMKCVLNMGASIHDTHMYTQTHKARTEWATESHLNNTTNQSERDRERGWEKERANDSETKHTHITRATAPMLLLFSSNFMANRIRWKLKVFKYISIPWFECQFF